MRKFVLSFLVVLALALWGATQWIFSEALGHLLTDWLFNTLALRIGLRGADVIAAVGPYVPSVAVAIAAIYGAYRVGAWERQQRPNFRLDYPGDAGVFNSPFPGAKLRSLSVVNTKGDVLRECQLRAETVIDKNKTSCLRFAQHTTAPFDLKPYDNSYIPGLIENDTDPSYLAIWAVYNAGHGNWYPIAENNRLKLPAEDAPYEIKFRVVSHDSAPCDICLRVWREDDQWRFSKL